MVTTSVEKVDNPANDLAHFRSLLTGAVQGSTVFSENCDGKTTQEHGLEYYGVALYGDSAEKFEEIISQYADIHNC